MFSITSTKLKNYLIVRSKNIKTILIIVLSVFTNVCLAQDDNSENLKHGVKTIVIDPGHGGKDPGTHGEMVNEKEVVLAISLKLADYIKDKYPYMNVILTRESDVFLSLSERAEIANENNADLFLCIHANSSGSNAYGVETYVLGLHRTESQQKVAERENSTLLFEENGKEKYANFNLTPDAIIARQLQLSVNLDKSIDLASRIQKQVKSLGRRNRGVKQAGFWVLYKTTVPSLLIETGFLSNKKEELFLSSKEGQIKMANGIFRAFQEYVAAVNGVEALVENAKGYDASIKKAEKEDAKREDIIKKKIEEEKAKKGDAEKEMIKEEVVKTIEKKGVVYFKVQILTSSKERPADDKIFRGLTVSQYRQNGFFKYTSGLFEDDFESANQYKKEMQKNGFPKAFVVGFVDGERIPIAKAIKLSKK